MMQLLRRLMFRLLDRPSPGMSRLADLAGLGRLSLPVVEAAELKPGRTTWLVARAITLRGF